MRNLCRHIALVAVAALAVPAFSQNPPSGFPPNGTPAASFLVDLAELATTTDQAILAANSAQADNLCVADPAVFDAFEQAFVAMRSQLSIASSALASGQSCSPQGDVAERPFEPKVPRYDPTCNTNSSIEISDSIKLTGGDLECFGTLFVHVSPGSEVNITVPLYNPFNTCTPAVIVTADNMAIFTVTGPSGEILHHFTTRGGVYRNAASNTWIRFL